jgi:hypothetical protein
MFKNVRLGKSLLAIVLSLLVSALLFAPANAAEVAVTVEKLTVDGGFIVEPELVTLSGSETMADVITRLLASKFPGITACTYTGTVKNWFYMSEIYDPSLGGMLGEFGKGRLSGWMVTLNNYFIKASACEFSMSNGNVMRWQYTKTFGGEIGTNIETLGPSSLPSKDKLIWKVAEINKAGNKSAYGVAYTQAMSVLSDLDASEADIDSALVELVPGSTVEPDDPGDPDSPSDPDSSDAPDAPDAPDKPDYPATPDDPSDPDSPDNPNDPASPVAPDDPNSPDNSGQPGGSGIDALPSLPTLPDVPAGVTPVEPSAVTNADELKSAGLPIGWLEAGRGGYVLTDAQAKESSKAVLGDGVTAAKSLPVFSASAGNNGGIAAVGFDVKGAALLAASPKDVKLIKARPDEKHREYKYDASGYLDGTFLVLRGREPYAGALAPDETYTLVLFIKDGGAYDLGNEDGRVIDPCVIVKAEEKEAQEEQEDSDNAGNSGGGGGGCDSASFGLLALAALGFIARGRGSR